MSEPKILKTTSLHEGWGRLFLATIELPDGTQIRREVEDHGPAVAVLPYDPERRVAMMVRQLRAPALHVSGETSLLEAPAGLLESEDPEDCARRELLEETGIEIKALERISSLWSMPGISTERMDYFLAPYGSADRKATGGGLAHEQENITLEEVPLRQLVDMAQSGALSDLKTVYLLCELRLRRPDLFA